MNGLVQTDSTNYNMVYCSISKSKILNFLLTIKFSFFLYFSYVTIKWKKNLPYLNKFFSPFLSSSSPAIEMSKSVQVWPELDN